MALPTPLIPPRCGIATSATLGVTDAIHDYSSYIGNNNIQFLKHRILPRFGFLLLSPVFAIAAAIDAIIGIGAAMLALGAFLLSPFFDLKYTTLADVAASHIHSIALALVSLWISTMGFFNPHFFCRHTPEGNTKAQKTLDSNGLLHHELGHKIRLKAGQLYQSDNILKKHVLSRIAALFSLPVSLIGRIADGIIGAAAMLLSYITFGTVKSFVDTAYRGLQVPGIIGDALLWIPTILSPQIVSDVTVGDC